MVKETEKSKKFKLKNKDWTKWDNVLEEFILRMAKAIEANEIQIEINPSEYGIAQEKIMAEHVFGDLLWDIFFHEHPDFQQVYLEHSPIKTYAHHITGGD